MYIYICEYIYVYMHIHIYMYIYIYVHVHLFSPSSMWCVALFVLFVTFAGDDNLKTFTSIYCYWYAVLPSSLPTSLCPPKPLDTFFDSFFAFSFLGFLPLPLLHFFIFSFLLCFVLLFCFLRLYLCMKCVRIWPLFSRVIIRIRSMGVDQ